MARDLKVARNTVRKTVLSEEPSFSYDRTVQPRPNLGLWIGELERRLEADEKKQRRDRLTYMRLYEELAAPGQKGRLLRGAPLCRAYQFDWSHEYAILSGVTIRVKAVYMPPCHSRMLRVQLFPREGQEMVFAAHERAFAFFGGGLPARHLRQHEAGGECGLRRQGACPKSALPGNVLPPSGRAGGLHLRGRLGEGPGRRRDRSRSPRDRPGSHDSGTALPSLRADRPAWFPFLPHAASAGASPAS